MSQQGGSWQQDPNHPFQERWWSGTIWTEHTRPSQGMPQQNQPIIVMQSAAPVINNNNVVVGGARRGFNHTTHLVLTLFTCGIWFPIWFLSWIVWRAQQ